jgi:hypothetical protein
MTLRVVCKSPAYASRLSDFELRASVGFKPRLMGGGGEEFEDEDENEDEGRMGPPWRKII